MRKLIALLLFFLLVVSGAYPAWAQFPNSVGGSGFSASLIASAILPPVPGVVQTFDYTAANDGVSLLTGGPTIAGYQANLASGKKFIPRFDDNALTPGSPNAKGGSDVFSGTYQWNADPAYAWSNGYTPFAIVGDALRIRAQTTASVSPAFAGGEIPTNPFTGAAYTYVSGILSTQATLGQNGGYVEINAQMPYGRATWPALALYPIAAGHPPEIDVVEYINTSANTIYQANTIVAAGQNPQYVNGGVNLSLDYHRYGADINFQAQTITYYLDGTAVGTPQSIASLPETMTSYYMVIGNQIGSNLTSWVQPPDGTTPNPADMLVRWFRVYQRPGPVSLSLSNTAYVDSFTAGQTVATLVSTNYSTSAASNTYAIVSDPDAMFAISGSNLNLAQAVPESTAASHNVTIKVTDSAGKSIQRLFTIRVLTAAPIQANYVTTSDMTNAYWTKNNTTASATDTILEVANTGQHSVYHANITRAAGVKTFRYFADVAPVNGRVGMQLQAFSGNFGADGAKSTYNVVGRLNGYSTFGGAWTAAVALPPASIPGSSSVRIAVDITTDASSTNVTLAIASLLDTVVESYTGDTTKGDKIANVWFYNKAAGTGGL